MSDARAWTLAQASRLLNEPQHRLIYLCEKQVVVPDVSDAQGRGSSRRFSSRNLLEFSIALHLRPLSISGKTVAAILHTLRALESRIRVQHKAFELVSALRGESPTELRAIVSDGDRLFFLMAPPGRQARLFGGVSLTSVKHHPRVVRNHRVNPSVAAGGADFDGPEGSRFVRLDINIAQIARELQMDD